MNSEMLREAINNSGVKLKHIANKLDLSRYGLYKKINGENEFTVSETMELQRILQLDSSQRDAIFFSDKVEPKSTGAKS